MNEVYDELTKIDFILDQVEKECIKEGKSIASVFDLCEGWDGKYLRNYFSFVADMSLGDYVRRRRLTEAFYKIKDFTSLKENETINGIKKVKSKIANEFGPNPKQHLQPYLYAAVSRQELEDRLEWKRANNLTKRKIIEDSKIVLFSNEGSDTNPIDWATTYLISEKTYFALHGAVSFPDLFEDTPNNLGFIYDGKWLESRNCGSNFLYENIYNLLAGKEVRKAVFPSLLLDVHCKGGFQICSLIKSFSWTGEKIANVECDKRLKIENNKLVLYLEEL